MAKPSRSVIYSLVGVVVLAAVIFLQKDNGPSKPGAYQSKAKKVIKTADSVFTEEDKKAKFDPITTPAKDIFTPIIARTKGISGLAGGFSGPIGIPAELTLGQPNWVYSGMAEVNNVPTALLENNTTQEGVFVKAGERWKAATVSRITSSEIILTGPDGARYTVKVNDIIETKPEKTDLGGFQPVRIGSSALSGPIGNPVAGGLEIQPDRNNRGNRSQRSRNVQNFN